MRIAHLLVVNNRTLCRSSASFAEIFIVLIIGGLMIISVRKVALMGMMITMLFCVLYANLLFRSKEEVNLNLENHFLLSNSLGINIWTLVNVKGNKLKMQMQNLQLVNIKDVVLS